MTLCRYLTDRFHGGTLSNANGAAYDHHLITRGEHIPSHPELRVIQLDLLSVNSPVLKLLAEST
jgi:hypothetical protein